MAEVASLATASAPLRLNWPRWLVAPVLALLAALMALSIGRYPLQRTRMAVVPAGRPAVTHYRVLERFGAHTWLAVQLETGRTHQIRVHMAHIRHPIVGDRTYGGRPRLPRGAGKILIESLQGFPRQALHATRLGLEHPVTGEVMHWEVPVPDDMRELLEQLRKS